jgi:histidinol-phosphate/aromatic aminotransferase/cobyric acid decarboxylase-like protein
MIKQNSKNGSGNRFTSEQYARLKAEAAAPYRGLRKFIYVAFGASGFIGALIFLAQLAAGRDVVATLPNFALQIGVVALMIFLFRLEKKQ